MGLIERWFKGKARPGPIDKFPATGDESERRSYPRMYSPGSKVDWTVEAGGRRLDTNGVVALGINHYQTNWSSARLCVGRMSGGDFQEIPDHPFAKSLEEPNPWYGGDALWAGTIVSDLVIGNSFWAVGSRNGGDPAFAYMSHLNLDVVGGGPGEFVRRYEYRLPGTSQVVKLKPEEVVHFRRGMSLDDQKLGLSPLQTLIREIGSDNLASAYSGGLLKNFGATALVLAAKEAMDSATPEEAESLAELFRRLYSVDNAGKVAILPFPAEEVSRGFSPEEMALKSLRDVPVSRILAGMGLNAMALDLPSDNKTYTNYEESVEATWRQGILPTMARMALTLTRVARAWYGDNTLVVRFDTSNIDALQDDKDALWSRVDKSYQVGAIKRKDALRLKGLEFDEVKDDVYIHDVTGLSMDRGKAVTEDAKKRARDRQKRVLELEDEDAD